MDPNEINLTRISDLLNFPLHSTPKKSRVRFESGFYKFKKIHVNAAYKEQWAEDKVEKVQFVWVNEVRINGSGGAVWIINLIILAPNTNERKIYFRSSWEN